MKKIVLAVLLFLLIVIFLQSVNEIKFVQDDAFITFRYVKNFLDGQGLVFNPGEYVEGYTSFFWVMILAGLGWIGVDYVAAAQILSITFGALSLIALYFVARQLNFKSEESVFLKETFNFLPVVLFLFTGGFQYWSVSGMETSLFVFLILLAVLLYQIKLIGKQVFHLDQIALVFASLTRPEGIFIWLLFSMHFAFHNRHSFGFYFKNEIIYDALYFVIPILAYLCFRLTYYGYPFPNTFYAKTGFGSFYLYRGLVSIIESFKQYLWFGLFLVLPLFLLKVGNVKQIALFYYYFVISFIIAIVLIGGDVLPMHRFMLPVLPIIYILFSKSLQHFVENGFKSRLTQTIFALLVFSAVSIYAYKNHQSELPDIYEKRGYEIGLVTKMKIYAEFINTASEGKNKLPVVSLSTIGALAYYSKARVIDLIGLTDEYIAHNPKEEPGIDESIPLAWKERIYNIEYVLKQKPDYIIFPAGAKPSAYPEAALFSRSEFHKMYYPQIFFSYELNQFLPVFSLRENATNPVYPKEQNALDCKKEFLAYYIRANNYLLSFLEWGDSSLISKSLSESFKMIENCPARISEAYTTIGYTYFHTGAIGESRKFLEAAVDADSMNCLALLYLSKVFAKEDDSPNYLKTLKLLKQYSVDAVPYFNSQ